MITEESKAEDVSLDNLKGISFRTEQICISIDEKLKFIESQLIKIGDFPNDSREVKNPPPLPRVENKPTTFISEFKEIIKQLEMKDARLESICNFLNKLIS